METPKEDALGRRDGVRDDRPLGDFQLQSGLDERPRDLEELLGERDQLLHGQTAVPLV